jgi:putative transposase
VGPIEGAWLNKERKWEILKVMDMAKEHGIPYRRSCEILGINRRRVARWRERCRKGLSLENGTPGPREPIHRLLSVERQRVLELARNEAFVNLSHRMLTVTAWDLEIAFVSFSSVYRIMRSENLTTHRGPSRAHNGRSVPPVRRELTGPNQRWCWDISYLPTYEKCLFLYLYLLLDEYSRKVIHWLVSWRQSARESRELLLGGLLAEHLLDGPESERPEIFNDRGRQMKAKTIRRMLEDLQMPQLFARPRTPDDNPFAESLFGTIKGAPEYPGRFLDQHDAEIYFTGYIQWYNTEHYHSGIEYVTPQQAHDGLREEIVARRRKALLEQRQLRKEVNSRIREIEDTRLINEEAVPTSQLCLV